jgi:ankyrin repeat protein
LGNTPLVFALQDQRYEAAKILIAAGAKVNVKAGEQQLTPLMIAAAQTSPAEGAVFLPSSARPIDIAQALINRGANVNAEDKDGMTALMVAASHNNAPMIGLLMQSGANAAAKNNRGQTAVDIAKLNGNLEAKQAISVLGNAMSGTSSTPGSGQRPG